MMAKRGDPVAKAFAGSLHACHDEEFTTVGKFSSGSFGSASFVRRGDGKQGYLAGLQNFSNLTLRILPWEEHAKRGMYFFSWKVVSYVLDRTLLRPKNGLKMSWKGLGLIFRSKMLMELKYGIQRVLDPQQIISDEPSKDGFIKLTFKQGTIAAIGLEDLAKGEKKDTSFIQHLALSMLPPFLPSVVDIDANWCPEGWPSNESLSEDSAKSVAKIIDAWQGLVMNEGLVSQAIKRSILDTIDKGTIVCGRYVENNSYEELLSALQEVPGASEERELAAHIIVICNAEGFEDDEGIRINTRGEISERKTATLEIIDGASCGDILSALWTDYGLEALGEIGILGDEGRRNLAKAK